MPDMAKARMKRCLAALGCVVMAGLHVVEPMAQSRIGLDRSGGAQLPNLGDSAVMQPGEERRLGDRIAREIYRDLDYIDDAVLMDYVQGVWQPLLAAARQRGELTPELDERFSFEIALGRDRSVNAFALPGGYLGLHLGLMAIVATRDELASVLAHELSHVTQRHIPRVIARQNAQSPWLVGTMILGALAASKNRDAGSALMVGGQAVAAQSQLNFSRDMEREADRVGFGVVTQAGFEPMGFVTMFQKLQHANRLADSNAYPYLRSHPLTTERIADMQARLPQSALQALNPAEVSPAMEHAQLRARAEVLANSDADALRAWAAKLAAPGFAALDAPLRAGLLYGAALSAAKQRDFVAADLHLNRLMALTGHDVASSRQALLLSAEIYLAANQPQKAMARLQANERHVQVRGPSATALSEYQSLISSTQATAPQRLLRTPVVVGRPETLLFAQAELQTGDQAAAARVAERLQLWVADHPHDAQAWQLLSAARAALGQRLRAVLADAESHWAVMDYAGAQDRLRAGQELARALAREGQADHVEASIIDTRARAAASLLREQALER